MQQALAGHGPPVTPAVTARQIDEAAPVLTAAPFTGVDLVVKPAAAVCTDGVTPVGGGLGRESAVTALPVRRNAVGLVSEEVVVQRRLTGTEYVVNTSSHDGRQTVTDLRRYRKVANTGHFAVYQDVKLLPFDGPGHEELLAYVRGALEAFGFRFGPAHTEVMSTGDGPRLIEVNARVAGSGMAAAAALATGDNGIQRTVRYVGARPRRLPTRASGAGGHVRRAENRDRDQHRDPAGDPDPAHVPGPGGQGPHRRHDRGHLGPALVQRARLGPAGGPRRGGGGTRPPTRACLRGTAAHHRVTHRPDLTVDRR